jgi:peptide/nickel transport system substrate-binding protein
MSVTIWTGSDPALAQAAQSFVPLLRRLGFRAQLKQRPEPVYRPAVSNSRTRAQMGTAVINSDYPTASSFFALLTCRSFRPNTPFNPNLSEFCNPSVDALIGRALALQATNVHAANLVWARVDRAMVDQAPWVPLWDLVNAQLVSKRVGNFQVSPQWATLIDQLWVR